MSFALALVIVVEEMEVVAEGVVEVVRVDRVLAVVGGPGEEMRNCVTVLAKGAGRIGCLDEVPPRLGASMHHLRDWRRKESTAAEVASQMPTPMPTSTEDDAESGKKRNDPWKWRRLRLGNRRGRRDDDE